MVDTSRVLVDKYQNRGNALPLHRPPAYSCSPASIPCPIEDLTNLPTGPIRKISSGGYLTAALTTANDLYVWGGRPGQVNILPHLTRVPTPADLNGADVFDIAVGSNHLIALSTEHRIFVVGDGSNGQLGMDVKELREWKEVILPLNKDQQVHGIHAGYKTSFVIVENVSKQTNNL